MKYFTNLFHNVPLIKLIPILIFFFSLIIPAQTPQYYNYENVGSSFNSFPFGQPGGKLVDWLFLPEEINQPTLPPTGDLIVKIYFFIPAGFSATRTFTDLVVMMAQDTITSLVSGQLYQGEMDTVYYSQYDSLSSVELTWMGIELDTPFPYDPSKSLILGVGQCGSAGSSVMRILQNALSNTGLRRVWSVGGCPFSPYNSGDFSIINFGIDLVVVPVELISFSATTDSKNVNLNWSTATELNNSGFQVEKKSDEEYEAIGFVPGFGTTTEPRSYSFTDAGVQSGYYTYRLKQIDLDGTFEYSDEIQVEVTIPDVFALEQNYPNPFNPSTRIDFSLAVDSKVSLKVFDVLGQEITTLINSDLVAGSHNVEFNAANINSGVYFYILQTENYVETKKMILLK